MDHGCCPAGRRRLARPHLVTELIEYRAATDDELETCIQLQQLVFRPGQEDAPIRYRSYVREDPTYQPGQTRVAVKDGQIVGHLRVWDRKLSVRGLVLTTGGIGSLLTHPEFRGQGIASGILRDTERYFEEVDYDMGLLFSIIGTAYYASRGWTAISIPTFVIDLGSTKADTRPEIRKLTLDLDLEGIRHLHASLSANYTGIEVRNEAYWSTGPAKCRSVFPAIGVERQGRLAGYVNWDGDADDLWISECCANDEDVYTDLASVLLRAANEAGATSLQGSLPTDHPLVASLVKKSGYAAKWGAHDEMMVKISRWDLLREKLRTVIPDLPSDFPVSQAGIDAFWLALLGSSVGDSEWCDRLGPCPPIFYWWKDIF